MLQRDQMVCPGPTVPGNRQPILVTVLMMAHASSAAWACTRSRSARSTGAEQTLADIARSAVNGNLQEKRGSRVSPDTAELHLGATYNLGFQKDRVGSIPPLGTCRSTTCDRDASET